jgi:hypothetical protein
MRYRLVNNDKYLLVDTAEALNHRRLYENIISHDVCASGQDSLQIYCVNLCFLHLSIKIVTTDTVFYIVQYYLVQTHLSVTAYRPGAIKIRYWRSLWF